jgi:hypothetical protein
VRPPPRQLGAAPRLDFLEVERRHERLHMARDFVRLVSCWALPGPPPLVDPGAGPLCRLLDLTRPLPTAHEVAALTPDGPAAGYDPAPPPGAPVGSTVYNAKVVLANGLRPEDVAAAAAGGAAPGGDAVARLLRLVVARAERAGKERTGVFALGGRFDPGVDGGGDPADDDAPLIRAATRHVAAQVGLHLGACARWIRFAEVHYQRLDRRAAPHHAEVTVLFLVADAAEKLLPAAADWPAVWAARQAAKAAAAAAAAAPQSPAEAAGASLIEEGELLPTPGAAAAAAATPAAAAAGGAPPSQQPPAQLGEAQGTQGEVTPEPHLLLAGVHTPSLRLKTMSISLDGLLDYDDTDREEGAFELSLFAESFQEAAQRDAGDAVLRALQARR